MREFMGPEEEIDGVASTGATEYVYDSRGIRFVSYENQNGIRFSYYRDWRPRDYNLWPDDTSSLLRTRTPADRISSIARSVSPGFSSTPRVPSSTRFV